MRGVLGEYISYNLSWTKDVSKQCSKMLGFIRFIINTRFVMSSTMVRRSLCQSDPTWATPRKCGLHNPRNYFKEERQRPN